MTRGAFRSSLTPSAIQAAKQLVIGLARLRQDAADVRHAAGRLEQHQAAFRGGAVEAPAVEVVGQGAVVEQRIVAAQRQLEAVLALGRAVAGAGVAAQLATAPASRRGRS